MNSKQLFLTTALITSLSSTAIADVSISGEAKVNSRGAKDVPREHYMEADLTITGKSGDTSVIAQLSLDNGNSIDNHVEQLYMTSKVAGIDVKAGVWKSGKGELGVSTTKGEWPRMQASTSFGGLKLAYQDMSGNAGTWVAVAGTLGGVKVMHKVKETSNETKLSGSMGGVNLAYHGKSADTGDHDDSITLKTSVQGVDFTYVNTKSDAGTLTDGFIAKDDTYGVITKADAFGISTTIFGNKITYKDTFYNTGGFGDTGTHNKKLIITRKIASGSTFEATLDDNAESLDLELAVKF